MDYRIIKMVNNDEEAKSINIPIMLVACFPFVKVHLLQQVREVLSLTPFITVMAPADLIGGTNII